MFDNSATQKTIGPLFREATRSLFSSKKALAVILGLFVSIGAQMPISVGELAIDLDTHETLMIISPLMAYIFGQSLADHGKEKAKIEKVLTQPNSEESTEVPENQTVSPQ